MKQLPTPTTVEPLRRKTRLHIQVQTANGMSELLLSPDTTIAIAGAYPAIERVLLQLTQETAAMEGDDDRTLGVLRGIKSVHDIFRLFREEGLRDLQAEEASVSH